MSHTEANRANAQLSTGPTTEQGRAISCLNHLVHGLSGAFRILKDENPEAFNQLLAALREEYTPATVTEETLVAKIAQHQWLADRALRLQGSAFGETTDEVDPNRLALFTRYHTTHERAYYRALNQLLKLRKERQKEEFGFESQNHKQRDDERKQEMHRAKIETFRDYAQARLEAFQAQADAKLLAASQPKRRKTREEQEAEDEAAVLRMAEMFEGGQNEDDLVEA